MNQNIPLVTAVAVGATAMFMLDPIQGRRRRAFARDKAIRASRRTGRFLGASARDTSHRLAGLRAKMRPSLHAGEVPDDTLVARVRAAIGRAVSHPGAVHVMVEDAIVCLDGTVLADEADALNEAVRDVEGVLAIDNRIRVCENADHVPALQGTGTPPPSHLRHLARSPMVRLCAGLGVAALAFGVASAAMSGADRDEYEYEYAGPEFI